MFHNFYPDHNTRSLFPSVCFFTKKELHDVHNVYLQENKVGQMVKNLWKQHQQLFLKLRKKFSSLRHTCIVKPADQVSFYQNSNVT